MAAVPITRALGTLASLVGLAFGLLGLLVLDVPLGTCQGSGCVGSFAIAPVVALLALSGVAWVTILDSRLWPVQLAASGGVLVWSALATTLVATGAWGSALAFPFLEAGAILGLAAAVLNGASRSFRVERPFSVRRARRGRPVL
jgi:hypothetical protein